MYACMHFIEYFMALYQIGSYLNSSCVLFCTAFSSMAKIRHAYFFKNLVDPGFINMLSLNSALKFLLYLSYEKIWLSIHLSFVS